jgi:hypothetical protein
MRAQMNSCLLMYATIVRVWLASLNSVVVSGVLISADTCKCQHSGRGTMRRPLYRHARVSRSTSTRRRCECVFDLLVSCCLFVFRFRINNYLCLSRGRASVCCTYYLSEIQHILYFSEQFGAEMIKVLETCALLKTARCNADFSRKTHEM